MIKINQYMVSAQAPYLCANKTINSLNQNLKGNFIALIQCVIWLTRFGTTFAKVN
jgi:hypothetical protein